MAHKDDNFAHKNTLKLDEKMSRFWKLPLFELFLQGIFQRN
jgi:hypothetical protein